MRIKGSGRRGDGSIVEGREERLNSIRIDGREEGGWTISEERGERRESEDRPRVGVEDQGIVGRGSKILIDFYKELYSPLSGIIQEPPSS